MAEAKGDYVTIEIEALANEIENTMRSTNLFMSPRRCIFKVPDTLKRHNPTAYAPNAFSIGPYHHDKEHLKATKKIKLKYLHDLISGFEDPKAMLRTLIRAMREVEQDARDCYAEPIHITRDEFVKILVLDGCFLIELFRKNADEDLQKDDDPVFTTSCMPESLGHDLILLENQIPWLVLKLLFDKTRKPGDPEIPPSTLILSYCQHTGILVSDNNNVTQPSLARERESKHILDMLRNSLVLSSGREHERSPICQSMPSATRLTEAGIKFKRGTSSNILDITFEDGVLEIPPLHVHQETESLFRNLICLEQCLPNCDPLVTSYAILLDNLINTTEDMEILCRSGTIDNWLNIDDATEFFNQLYDNTLIKEFYYAHLTANVKAYCGRRWPRYRTVLMRDYFNHPWALVSVLAAFILLILSFLQTVFTVIK